MTATTRASIVSACREALIFVNGFDVSAAAEIADQLIDGVVATLRRDPRLTKMITRNELELLLADLRARIEHDLYQRLGDFVDEREAIHAIADHLSEEHVEVDAHE